MAVGSGDSKNVTQLDNKYFENILLITQEFESNFVLLVKPNIASFMPYLFNININIEDIAMKLNDFLGTDSMSVNEEIVNINCDLHLKSI